MVSININLSSLIVQGNLTSATNGLNKAIERLSTGYKINHASDNAANYSIANSYESKLSSYEVAASNVQSGLDLLSVAQDTISTMQDHGARLQALITQARNGTYGTQSLTAMTQEAGALISEIQRMYMNTEYNGISLFDNFPLPDWAKELKSTLGTEAGVGAGIEEGQTVGIEAGQTVGLLNDITLKANGFIADIETVTPDIVVETAGDLADAISNYDTIGIANAEVLAELATLVNSGTNCTGTTIVLADDIDLSDYQAGEGWTPIGTTYISFNGTFDGQGHKITGLKINNSSTSYQGLFANAGENSEIKNIGIVDCDVNGSTWVGSIVGITWGTISNCYSSGNVTGASNSVGGIAGQSKSIDCSYSGADVSGFGDTGGLVGDLYAGSLISNSFATGNVTGRSSYTGGLVGKTNTSGTIRNCYATGDVKGTNEVGGLVGRSYTEIINCYTTNNVSGTGWGVGGLIGNTSNSAAISNSYATGNIDGASLCGGLAGSSGDITNSYATGNVSATGASAGGLAGSQGGTISHSYAAGNVTSNQYTGGLTGVANGFINDSYATGTVTGTGEDVGGLVGYLNKSGSIVSNSYASGDVSGTVDNVGGLVGYTNTNTKIINSYASGNTIGSGNNVGGLVGQAYTNSVINNSYAIGSVKGNNKNGGLVGYLYENSSIEDSYAAGKVIGLENNSGGLVGYMATKATISNSYSTSDVEGKSKIGGLIGYAYATSETSINNTYATGNVKCTQDYAGGLIGSSYFIVVNNSYANGEVYGANCTGGLIGEAKRTSINNSYSRGNVTGTSFVGGFVGKLTNTSTSTVTINKAFSSGTVNGDTQIGDFIGGVVNTTNGSVFRDINIANVKVMKQNIDIIGFEGKNDGTTYESGQMATWLENIRSAKAPETNLQVGIMGDSSSKITFDTGFEYDLNSILTDIKSDKAYSAITKFMSTLSAKATDLGAVSNRLESSLESIAVNMENLGNSLSTVKDVDMAEVSSEYIKKQILQQASATLLATANQSPAIALQLI